MPAVLLIVYKSLVTPILTFRTVRLFPRVFANNQIVSKLEALLRTGLAACWHSLSLSHPTHVPSMVGAHWLRGQYVPGLMFYTHLARCLALVVL